MLDWTTVVEMLPYMPGTHSAQSVKWQGKNHRQIFKLTIKIFWLQNDVASDTVCLCGLTVKCPQYNYSVIFSRWRQFAPHLLHGSLGISVGSAIFGRPYYRTIGRAFGTSVCRMSVCRLSVTFFCIVAKQCILAKKTD